MQDVFRAERLSARQARLAFHLVRLCEPRWTLSDWQELTRRLCRCPPSVAGLMAIRDRRGVFHALFGYGTVQSLQLGRSLRIGDLIVAHLIGSAIDDVVVECAERLAAELACDNLLIDLPAESASSASRRLRTILAERFRPVAMSHRRASAAPPSSGTTRP